MRLSDFDNENDDEISELQRLIDPNSYPMSSNEVDPTLEETPTYDTDDEMQSEIEGLESSLPEYDPSMEAAPAVTQAEAPRPLNDLLSRYKGAQADRSRDHGLAMLMEGLGTMSTAYGTRGQKTYKELNPSGFDAYRKLADQKVTDIEGEISQRPNIQKVYTEEELADPESSISTLARDFIKQKFPTLNVGNLSAKQLESLGFKVGSLVNNQSRDRKIPITLRDEKTGLPMQYNYNMDTGEKTLLGEKAFAPNVKLGTYGGEYIPTRDLQRGISDKGKPITLSEENKAKASKQEKFIDDATVAYSKLQPNDIKEVDELKKNFQTETKTQRESYEAIDNITDVLVGDATKNEIAASQLGAQVANIYENGRLTDEDVLRYTRRKSVASRLKDGARELSKGTISPEKAEAIKSALVKYKEALKKKLSERALEKANTLTPRLRSRGIAIEPKHLSPSLFGEFDPDVLNGNKKTYPPGTILNIKGTSYKVGPDGMKLIPMGNK